LYWFGFILNKQLEKYVAFTLGFFLSKTKNKTMTINNNLITFSIILFRTEEDYKNELYYTSRSIFLWDHRTDSVKEIELPGLKGSHMIDLTNKEHETLWLDILKKELFNLLNEDGSEGTESNINIYLHSIIYNNKLGGRYIKTCIISINNLDWFEINKAEQEYENIGLLDIKNGSSFFKFYNELITSPIYF